MKQQRSSLHALRKLALRYPDVEEGIACEGTAAERRTVKARSRAFLFLGVEDAMVKLRESLPEATTLAQREPDRYRVGANGWVKATFIDGEPLPLRMLEKWIRESYRLLVTPEKTHGTIPTNKERVAKTTSGSSKAAAKATAKKKAAATSTKRVTAKRKAARTKKRASR